MKKFLLAATIILTSATASAATMAEIQQHLIDLYNGGATFEQIVTQDVADSLEITLEELDEYTKKIFVDY